MLNSENEIACQYPADIDDHDLQQREPVSQPLAQKDNTTGSVSGSVAFLKLNSILERIVKRLYPLTGMEKKTQQWFAEPFRQQ